jgi:hypothetical protein
MCITRREEKKAMSLSNIFSQFTPEELQKLAMAESMEALWEAAKELGHTLTEEEAEAVFATLFPVRGQEPLDEDELAMVVGGFKPTSSTDPTRGPGFSGPKLL